MSAKFTLEGSSAGAVKAVQDFNKALDEAQKKGDEAARSSKRLEDAARRIAEQADPQKKYNRQLQEMAEHVAAGRLAAEDAAKAAEALGRQLYENSEEGKKAAAEAVKAAEAEKRRAENQRKALAIQLEAGRRQLQLEKERAAAAAKAAKEEEEFADAARKIRESIAPHEKLNRLTEELAQHVRKGTLTMEEATAAHRKYRQELGLVAEASKDTFGPSAIDNLANYALGMVGIGSVVGGLTKIFSDVEAAAQEAADSIVDALGVAGELQQLGPEAFARGAATARSLVGMGVVSDLTQAFGIATNLENAGFSEEENKEFIDRLIRTRVVSAENVQQAGGDLKKFKTAFGVDAGSLGDVIDKALFVSTIEGVQSSFSQTVNETLKFASLYKDLGFSDEEALASFAGVEPISASRDNASEAIKSFAVQVGKKNLAVQGDFFGTLDNVQSQIDKGANPYDLLGEQNAVIGFQRLQQQRELIRQHAQGLLNPGAAATASSGLLATDPSLAAGSLRKSAEGQLAQTREQLDSTTENLTAAVRAARVKAATELFGGSGLGSFGAGFGVDLSDWLGGEVQLLEQEAAAARSGNSSAITGVSIPGPNGTEVSLLQAIEQHLNALNGKVGAKVTTQQE